MSAEKLVAVKTEVQLLGWGDTSTRGRTVTFLLPDEGDQHPFRDYAIRSGKTAGHRFYLVCAEIGDDELPIKQELRLSQQAAILCKERQFWFFAGERSICNIASDEDARNWMLTGARIGSRKEFDTNKAAADWFVYQVKLPYEAYKATVNGGVL